MISCGPHTSLERERKIRRRLFTSSMKRKIRHFHVVVVQSRQRNVQKKRDARAKLLFWLTNQLLFCLSRCRRRRKAPHQKRTQKKSFLAKVKLRKVPTTSLRFVCRAPK